MPINSLLPLHLAAALAHIWWGAALSLCSSAAASAAPAQTALGPELQVRLVSLHRRADDALRSGDYELAGQLFAEASDADPQSGTYSYGLACAEARRGQRKSALDHLKRALDLGYSNAALVLRDDDLRSIISDTQFKAMFPWKRSTDTHPGTVTWRFSGSWRGLVVAPDGVDWVALASLRDGAVILERRTGKVRHRLSNADAPPVALARGSGDQLLVLYADGDLVIADAATGDQIDAEASTFAARAGGPVHLSAAADGTRIVVQASGRLLVWNESGEYLHTVETSSKDARWTTGATPNSPLIPEVQGETLRFFHIVDGRWSDTVFTASNKIRSAEIAPDGKSVAIGTEFANVHLLDMETGEARWSKTVADSATGTGVDLFNFPLTARVLRFDPEGKRLAVSTTTGFFIAAFDVEEGTQLWRTGHLGGRMGGAFALSMTNQLVVGDRGNHVWDAKTGKELGFRKAKKAQIYDAVDSSLLSHSADEVALLDALSGEPLWIHPRVQELLQVIEHPSGWKSGPLPEAVARVSARSFDPKRIRMARQGYALLPPPKTE